MTAGIATLSALVFTTLLLIGDESSLPAIDSLGLLCFAVFGATCSAVAAWFGRGRHRTAWLWMTLGLTGWVIGEAVWCSYELWFHRPTPFPSLADAGFLLFPVGAAAALAFFPSGHTASSRTRLFLDGLIVAGAMFVVSWVSVLAAVYDAGGIGAFALAVSVAYPVADIVLITVAVLVLSRARAAQRVTLAVITVGIVLMALADSGFVYLTAHEAYYSGHPIDLGWMAGLLMLGAAALTSTRERYREPDRAESPDWVRHWLPYLPLLVAGAVAVVQVVPNMGPGPVPMVAFGLVVAVLVRQVVVVREDRRRLTAVSAQALRDPLTGLANRILFLDRLDHALALQRRERRQVAIVSVDLDNFKHINDHFGHLAGDTLLIRIAERMLGSVRTADTVARLGGDEFAVLVEDGSGHPGLIAHRVAEAFDAPFVLDGHTRHVRASIGLAILTADDTDTSAERLLKQADIAMYSAKHAATGRVHTFTPGMRLTMPAIEPVSAIDRSEDIDLPSRATTGGPNRRPHLSSSVSPIVDQLRRAIDRGELTVHYLPTIDLATGALIRVESLVRWPHPHRGLLLPDQFLPLVREHGLMRAVTDLVLDTALGDAVDWKARGHLLPISINLFSAALGDADLSPRIADALSRHNLPTHTLTVEIAEDDIFGPLGLAGPSLVRSHLTAMAALGIRICVDDFGTGHSSLKRLRELPIDEVKLDRKLIAPVTSDHDTSALVASIIGLVHALGATAVAEGVEDAATAAALTGYGCDAAQGFLYGGPMSTQTLVHRLAAREAWTELTPLPGNEVRE